MKAGAPLDEFRHSPRLLDQSSGNSRRSSDRTVETHEVVVREIHRGGRSEVAQRLRETIPEPRRALVSHAVCAASEMKGEVLEFCTTDRDLQFILRHRGFLRLGGYRMFYYGAKGTPIADKEPEQLGDWWWNGCDIEDTFAW